VTRRPAGYRLEAYTTLVFGVSRDALGHAGSLFYITFRNVERFLEAHTPLDGFTRPEELALFVRRGIP
jgi:hypothetical protein